ncbi:MAG: PAS domain S-box protein [Chloroflexi bacterium]|nr:MAG: PAS domain S-box protein [Chloroflexota bacterium]
MSVSVPVDGSRRSSRPKWHRLYYLLAAFDLITVVLSLGLNHQTRNTFAGSVAVNQVWSQRLADYSELGQLAGAVDAPGNDIFDSLDLDYETARFRAALQRYDDRFEALREEAGANMAGDDGAGILEDLDAVGASMVEMTSQAELIFSFFAQGQPREAARWMATMDRRYAKVLTAMADLRRDVNAIQQANLAEQEAIADSLARFEYVIAATVVLMIGRAVVYGHTLFKRMEADAQQLDRYLDELRDAEARTRSIVDTAPDGIVTFDEDGSIETGNASAACMFGTDVSAIAGQNIGRYVPQLLPVEAPRWSSPAGGRTRGELTGWCADGGTFPLEVAVSELRLGGRRMSTAILRDVTERKRAEEERNQLNVRLQDLVRRLLVAEEEERRRVAYEVHDGVAQMAAAVQLHCEALASHLHPRSPEVRQEIAQLRVLSQQTVREARRVIAGLRPAVLDDFGLAAAVRLEVDALRDEGWSITYDEGLGPQRLPSTVETALYRVAQEAVRNVRKHAGRSRVHVGLQRESQTVRLEVRDWGRGFHADGQVRSGEPGKHVGISSMQERVALLGGHFGVRSQPGAGTHVVIEVPAPATREAVAV